MPLDSFALLAGSPDLLARRRSIYVCAVSSLAALLYHR